MAIALSILAKIFTYISPINEWEEIKKGNMAVALVLSSVIIGTAFVIGMVVMP